MELYNETEVFDILELLKVWRKNSVLECVNAEADTLLLKQFIFKLQEVLYVR